MNKKNLNSLLEKTKLMINFKNSEKLNMKVNLYFQ